MVGGEAPGAGRILDQIPCAACRSEEMVEARAPGPGLSDLKAGVMRRCVPLACVMRLSDHQVLRFLGSCPRSARGCDIRRTGRAVHSRRLAVSANFFKRDARSRCAVDGPLRSPREDLGAGDGGGEGEVQGQEGCDGARGPARQMKHVRC